jgi:hypothetical protein
LYPIGFTSVVQFVGAFIKALYAWLGTKQCLSTAYHPQSDGQSERMNRVLEETLRHYVSADMTNWDLHLPLREFAVNNSYNESTKSTPFCLNYGRQPQVPLSPFSKKGQDMLTDEAVNAAEAAKSVADPVTAESVQTVPLMANLPGASV